MYSAALSDAIAIVSLAHQFPRGRDPISDRKVDIRLPEKTNSTYHGARPVHLIIKMIDWIRISNLQNSLFLRKTDLGDVFGGSVGRDRHRLLGEEALQSEEGFSRCRANMAHFGQTRLRCTSNKAVYAVREFQQIDCHLVKREVDRPYTRAGLELCWPQH